MKTRPKVVSQQSWGVLLTVCAGIGLCATVALPAEPEHRTLTGKLVAPPDYKWNLSETKGILQEQLPPFPVPDSVKSKGRRAENEWFQKWKATEAGQAFLMQPRKKYDLCVSSDGLFSSEKVAPGDYWLSRVQSRWGSAKGAGLHHRQETGLASGFAGGLES